jgi:transmembrane sensor
MKTIIRKYLKSGLSKLEEQKLYNWIQSDEKNMKLFKSEMTSYLFNNSKSKNVNTEAAFEVFKSEINKESNVILLKRRSYKTYLKYAAIIAVLISSTYFIKNALNPINEDTNSVTSNVKEKINNQIVIIQDDGSEVKLDQEREELSYINENSSKELLAYNEIKIPKGYVFRLMLSDSTVVWLNASTRLKYPKRFISSLKTRTVELEGEAFFEVAHNPKKPFIVITNGIEVEVLGTKFNVSSYTNEANINTTLVEGSVKVNDVNNNDKSIIIEPSYQASFNKNSMDLSSKKVNTLEYTSWMQKRIIFNDVPFGELVKKIERTYNVEIINNNEQIKKKRFTGQFDIENVDVIFKALSTIVDFDYEINNNKITIKT